jgi:hypothetical protein
MATPAFKRRSQQHSPKTWAKHQVFDEDQAKRLLQPTSQNNYRFSDGEPRKVFLSRGGSMNITRDPINPLPFDFVSCNDVYDRSPVSSLSCPDSPENHASSKHHEEGQNSWINLWNDWGGFSKEGTYLTKSTTHSDVSSLSDSSSSSSETPSCYEFERYKKIPTERVSHYKNAKHIAQLMNSSADRREAIIPKEVYFMSHTEVKIAECNNILLMKDSGGEDSYLQSLSNEALMKGKTAVLSRGVQERSRHVEYTDKPPPQETQTPYFNGRNQFTPVLKNSSRKIFGGHNLDDSNMDQMNKRKQSLFDKIEIEKYEGLKSNGNMPKALECRKETTFKDVKKHVRRRFLKSGKTLEGLSNDEEDRIRNTPLHINSNSNLPHQELNQNYLYEESNGGVEVLILKKEDESSQVPQTQQCYKRAEDHLYSLDAKANKPPPKPHHHKRIGVKSLGVAMTKLFDKMKMSDVPTKVLFAHMESPFDDSVSSISSGCSVESLIDDYDSSYHVAQAPRVGRVPPQRTDSGTSFECTVHRVNVTNPEELEVEYDSILPKRATNGQHFQPQVQRRESSAVANNIWGSQMFVHDLEGDNLGFLEDKSAMTKSSF